MIYFEPKFQNMGYTLARWYCVLCFSTVVENDEGQQLCF